MSRRSVRIHGGADNQGNAASDDTAQVTSGELHVTLSPDSIDPTNGFLTVIGETHRLIHQGKLFDATGIAVAVAAAATFDVLMQFPVGVVGHLTNVEYTFDDTPVLIEFYEGTTFSAAGTASLVVNKNRLAAATAPGAVITENPTVTSPGTLIHQRYVPSGGNKVGILVPGEQLEWVLGNGTDYMWRVTNNTNGPIDIGYHFNGYEL